MRRDRPSWTRWIAPGILALGLIACPAARAQEEEGGAGGREGRPLDGYLATGALCGLALFIVAKTARR